MLGDPGRAMLTQRLRTLEVEGHAACQDGQSYVASSLISLVLVRLVWPLVQGFRFFSGDSTFTGLFPEVSLGRELSLLLGACCERGNCYGMQLLCCSIYQERRRVSVLFGTCSHQVQNVVTGLSSVSFITNPCRGNWHTFNIITGHRLVLFSFKVPLRRSSRSGSVRWRPTPRLGALAGTLQVCTLWASGTQGSTDVSCVQKLV